MAKPQQKKPMKKENRVSNLPRKEVNKPTPTTMIYKEGMTVLEVAEALNKTNAEIVKKLMLNGLFVTQNQSIDRETIELLALEYGVELQDEVVTDITRFDEMEIVDDEKDLVKRPAVVTITGHVDHGKTTL